MTVDFLLHPSREYAPDAECPVKFGTDPATKGRMWLLDGRAISDKELTSRGYRKELNGRWTRPAAVQ